MTAQLILGSAAHVLRRDILPASIDMIYADPPFGNEQVWTGRAGSFNDKWVWTDESERAWCALRAHSEVGAGLIAAIARTDAARAYLAMMGELLIEARRALKPTGTLWLHFDDTMGAHLRILGEVVFGPEHALGQLIWRSARGKNSRRGFGRCHNTIASFARSRATRWRLARCRGEFTVGDPCFGVAIDGFAEDLLSSSAGERVGYPTQKPVALLERLIRCATLRGDRVLDPTCGSGTTLVAARRLDRRAIGIDLSPDALAAASARLALPVREQFDLFEAAA